MRRGAHPYITAESVIYIASVTGWSESEIRSLPFDRLAVYIVSCQICNGGKASYTYDNESAEAITLAYLDALEDYLVIKKGLQNGKS